MPLPADDPLAGSTPISDTLPKDDPLFGSTPARSVMDPKSTSMISTLKRGAKAIAPAAAGMATAVGGAEAGGAVGGVPGAIIGGLAGGAAQPIVSNAVEGAPPPSAGDVIKSSVINGIFTGVGKMGEAATKYAQTEDEVRGELMKLPQAERTVKNIGKIRDAVQTRSTSAAAETAKVSAQDMRNRDFWKAHGVPDQQIDSVMENPGLQQQLAHSIEAGDRYKQAYQGVKDVARESFHDRYQPTLPTGEVDPKPIGQAMLQAAQGAGEHELSPGFRSWLAKTGARLAPESDQSIVDRAQELPGGELRVAGRAHTSAPSLAGGREEAPIPKTAEDFQKLRTELSEQVPGNATPLDKKMAQAVRDQITGGIKTHMSPEQSAAFDALDAEYGRFMDVVNTLNPAHAEKYGQNVANALWDPAAKDSEMAVNFIRMAKEADSVHGSRGIMGDLRESFLNKALQATREPGKPFEELKGLQKLQSQFGGDKASRAVMGEMFGKSSPLADPVTFTKVVEAASDPKPIALKTAPGAVHTIMSSPYFQGMIAFGVLAGLTGTKSGGVFSALTGQKGPAAQALAIGAMLLGPPAIGWVVKSGNSPLQRAMVGYMGSPNAATAIKYASELAGSGFTAATRDGMPSPEQTAASR